MQCTFIHFKTNIIEKIKEYGIPSQVSDEFVADIFGKRSGSMYEEGLVDATSPEDFDTRLESCREIWNTREAPYAPSSGPRFHTYFVLYNILDWKLVERYGIHWKHPMLPAVVLDSILTLFVTRLVLSVTTCIKISEKLLDLALQQVHSLPMRV